MQIPLQVNFEGCGEPSEGARAAIEREMERLEEHNRNIIGCRITVTAPSHKHPPRQRLSNPHLAYVAAA
jgi:hypothetical protein